MSKLDDYARRLVVATNEAYANGFAAGQKSTFAPVSVTGRWWQSSNRKIYFAHAIEYDAIQRAIDNNPGLCQWMSEETTIEFK